VSLADLLNRLPADVASEKLAHCCGAMQWVQRVLAHRPFQDDGQLFGLAERLWWSLNEQQWREAFAAHPRIGDLESLRERFSATRNWASQEQAGVESASGQTLQQLTDGNRTYEERFGYTFIVCATGKSADRILQLLRDRLSHSPAQEFHVAAAEQWKITQIRLRRLVL